MTSNAKKAKSTESAKSVVAKMPRKEELLRIFDQIQDVRGIILPLIDEIVYLEEELDMLRRLPKIRVSSKNASIQKTTPAQKQYVACLQQYNKWIKTLLGVFRKDVPEEESPLRAYLNSRKIMND